MPLYTPGTHSNDIKHVWEALDHMIDNYDDSTGVAATIDYAHHEIHSGSSFMAGYSPDAAKNDGVTINITLTTPDSTKYLHMFAQGAASGAAFFYITEGATYTGGTALTAYNRNRNSDATTVATDIKYDCSPSGGTVVYPREQFGSGNKGGGASRDAGEVVLKANKVYVFTVESDAASLNLGLRLSWYEHTDLA